MQGMWLPTLVRSSTALGETPNSPKVEVLKVKKDFWLFQVDE